jgi:hypothetical protein
MEELIIKQERIGLFITNSHLALFLGPGERGIFCATKWMLDGFIWMILTIKH